MTRLSAWPCERLYGRLVAPGDKSVSHRALILGALAEGPTQIEGLLESEDVLRTVDALRQLGVAVSCSGSWCVEGRGSFCAPSRALDFGNSGTGARLMLGALAAYPLRVEFTGDESLRRRPMGDLLGPLRQMGARVEGGETLPLVLYGRRPLRPIEHVISPPSAQVKSALLLAALGAQGESTVRESEPTRAHTEVLLRHFGAPVEQDGLSLRVRGASLVGSQVRVLGDPSSAAFCVVAALVVPNSEVCVEGVELSSGRGGLYEVLGQMGADLHIEATQTGHRITARTSSLEGCVVPGGRVPSMVDEYPILSVAAACARGQTRLEGLGPLRVKESDRVRAIALALRANGVGVEEGEETLCIQGCGGRPPGGGQVATFCDHRIAMSFLVLGLCARAAVTVDEPQMIASSYPCFMDQMRRLGAVFS